MEIEDLLKTMLAFFQDIDKRLEKLNNELSIADIKQQEILHYIENHNLNAYIQIKQKEVDVERKVNVIEDIDGKKTVFIIKKIIFSPNHPFVLFDIPFLLYTLINVTNIPEVLFSLLPNPELYDTEYHSNR